MADQSNDITNPASFAVELIHNETTHNCTFVAKLIPTVYAARASALQSTIEYHGKFQIPADVNYWQHIDIARICLKYGDYKLANLDPSGCTLRLSDFYFQTPVESKEWDYALCAVVTNPINNYGVVGNLVLLDSLPPIRKSLRHLCINNIGNYPSRPIGNGSDGLNVWNMYNKTTIIKGTVALVRTMCTVQYSNMELYSHLYPNSTKSGLLSSNISVVPHYGLYQPHGAITAAHSPNLFVKVDCHSIAMVYEDTPNFISELTELEELIIINHDLGSELDLSANKKLKKLTISAPELTSIKLCENSKLEFIDVSETKIYLTNIMSYCRVMPKTVELREKYMDHSTHGLTILSYKSFDGW